MSHIREDTSHFWAIVQFIIALALAIVLLLQWLQ